MKKFLALMLALIMLMGMSVNVFASVETITECPNEGHTADTNWCMTEDNMHYKPCIECDDNPETRGKFGHKVHEAVPTYYTEGRHSYEDSFHSFCYVPCGYAECTQYYEYYDHYINNVTYCGMCGWKRPVYSSCGTSSCETTKVEKYEEPVIPLTEIRAAEEEAMVVNVITANKEQLANDDASVIPGVAYNMSAFTTTKGFIAGLNKVVKANEKETSVVIYTKKPFAFNQSLLKAINDGKKDFVYYFTHAGHVYSVTIPAGTDASTILEKNGFAGPLYVGKVLGTTTLVK